MTTRQSPGFCFLSSGTGALNRRGEEGLAQILRRRDRVVSGKRDSTFQDQSGINKKRPQW
ncbi:hypothetical protein EDWATA_01946 [Edwardsiella tarda ATCC 23685]|uniref:Uncharacterized protein n=1 Tax=Edwardsiella tarda ATCC 23685 TaxID=500638 RepID=D4F5B8_EDWTA|nr:hypothetical protein EDWATA_01946 [Edwardsiella tarda ATCC 23685]